MTTIIDVAKAAGVSFKTVSRVLNGEAGVRPATKDKVLRAAQGLNYRVNSAARMLRSKSPNLVVLFLNNPSLSYAQDVQAGAMAGCQEAGFTLVVQDPQTTDIIERIAAQDGVLGAILTPPQSDDPHILRRLKSANVPFVRIGTEQAVAGSNQVGIDDRAAAHEMTRYLLSLGHKAIGFVAGPREHDASLRRYEGYCHALAEAGVALDTRLVARGDFTYASGMAAAEHLLSESLRPTAIFASNDEMAAGCLAVAYRHNIRVPERLSVVGFDNAPIAQLVYPALTTIDQATRVMSHRAVELLDQNRRNSPGDAMGSKDAQSSVDHSVAVKLPHELIIRASTARRDSLS